MSRTRNAEQNLYNELLRWVHMMEEVDLPPSHRQFNIHALNRGRMRGLPESDINTIGARVYNVWTQEKLARGVQTVSPRASPIRNTPGFTRHMDGIMAAINEHISYSERIIHHGNTVVAEMRVIEQEQNPPIWYLLNALVYRLRQEIPANHPRLGEVTGHLNVDSDMLNRHANLGVMPLADITADDMLGLYESIQSNDNIPIYNITFGYWFSIRGAGRKKKNLPPYLEGRGESFDYVPTPDGYCGQIALVFATAFSSPAGVDRRRNLKRPDRYPQLLREAQELGASFGCTEPSMSVDDFAKFVQLPKYTRYRVIIVQLLFGTVVREHRGKDYKVPMVHTEGYKDPFSLYILLAEGHYTFLTSINALISGTSGNYVWCQRCLTKVNDENKFTHKCITTICEICHRAFETAVEQRKHTDLQKDSKHHIPCSRCRQICGGEECHKEHERWCMIRKWKKEPSPQYCLNCQRVHAQGETDKTHICYGKRCPACSSIFKPEDFEVHRCYLKPIGKKVKKGEARIEVSGEEYDADDEDVEDSHITDLKYLARTYYTYDFECMLEPTTMDVVFKRIVYTHVPNYCHVRRLYGDIDGKTEWEFKGEDTLKGFCSFTQRRDIGKRPTFIAHNSKGYDGRIVYEYFATLGDSEKIKGQVLVGAKVLSFGVNNAEFRDSMTHHGGSLANLGKSSGLKETKGDFPLLFNNKNNQSYIGPLPDIEYFMPDQKSPSKVRELYEWHREEKVRVGNTWNLQEELARYCKMDTFILCEAMKKYIESGIALSKMDPMHYMTAAGAAFADFRQNHMPPDSIAILKHEPRRTPDGKWDHINWSEAGSARAAMHGGLTNVMRMRGTYSWEQIDQGIYAKHMDVKSMYPSCMVDEELPCGAPERIDVGDYDTVAYALPLFSKDVFCGYLKCDLELTRYLHHPVVYCTDPLTGKLTGDLLPKQAIWIDSKTFHYALETGYVCTKLYCGYNFKKSKEIFRSYINFYMAQKEQFSKNRDSFKSEAAFSAWINDWKAVGVHIDADNVHKNDGHKAHAKLKLNSLWGKLCQRLNMPKTKTFTSAVEYQKFMDDIDIGRITLKNQRIVGTNIICSYHEIDNFSKLASTNVALGGMVPAAGRVKLTKMVHYIDDPFTTKDRRVYYTDTDSILYERRPGMTDIKDGHFLGEWENENPGCFIYDIVILGPKSYAYKYWEPVKKPPNDENDPEHELYTYRKDKGWFKSKTKLRFKGISSNSGNDKLVNFDSMVQLLEGEIEEIKVKDTRFCYTPHKEGPITSYDGEKVIQFKFDKGTIDPNTYIVYPYGHTTWNVGIDLNEKKRKRGTLI